MTTANIKILFCLGLYDRRYFEGFESITSPLTYLTQKKVMFEWLGASEIGFQELKDKLTSILGMTLPEGNEGFVVYFDDSQVILGCGLMQHGKVIDLHL